MTAPGPASDPVRAARKRVLVVLAGGFDPAGDDTPLSGAETPALDRMARSGRAGIVDADGATPFEGFMSLVAPGGPSLGACEARGAGVDVAPGEAAWRADFVTVVPSGEGRGLRDPRAGKVRDPEASALLAAAQAVLPGVRLHRLAGHRNLAVTAGPAAPAPSPFEMLGRPPHAGLGGDPRLLAWWEASHAALSAHDVNVVRPDLGENPANGLWFHGGGAAAGAVTSPLGPSGVLVGRGAVTAGLAACMGWTPSVVEGDEDALAAASLAALRASDLVVVRTEAALQAAAAGGHAARRDALSLLDARIVAPLLSALEEAGDFVLAVASDCSFDTTTRSVAGGGAPVAVLRSGDRGDGAARFTEQACRTSGFHASAADLAALLRG